jgi:hypothetical protein
MSADPAPITTSMSVLPSECFTATPLLLEVLYVPTHVGNHRARRPCLDWVEIRNEISMF